uniref:Tyrosine-protein kinase ephrin type A/B receptor-like domain-containing protein n=1 Tax=Laticauda laticaudata TaxID=8630 RepID=A0A8C5RSJ2_LATLA
NYEWSLNVSQGLPNTFQKAFEGNIGREIFEISFNHILTKYFNLKQIIQQRIVYFSGTSCDCLPGFKKVFDKDGTSITCEKCAETMNGVTQDGWDCITCPSGLTIEGKCICANNEILVERNTNGSLLKAALCVQCDGKEQSFSTANTLNNMCKRCQPTFISVNKSCSCFEPNILVSVTNSR